MAAIGTNLPIWDVRSRVRLPMPVRKAQCGDNVGLQSFLGCQA